MKRLKVNEKTSGKNLRLGTFLLSIAAFAIFAAGCISSSSPEDTFDRYVEAFNDKDIDKMCSCFLEKDRELCEEYVSEGGLNMGPGDHIISYEVLEKDVKGDSAQMKIRLTGVKDGEKETVTGDLYFVKKDDKWYIDIRGGW